MNIQDRKDLLVRLGAYMLSDDEAWQAARHRAFLDNNWFIPEFIQLAVSNIAHNFLQPAQLDELIGRYALQERNPAPKKVGIVMAGNIPLVGFHDFLCVFLSGHYAFIKPSSKDEVMIKHVVQKLTEWNPAVADWVVLGEMLKGCDAYIATGSNNTGRYFEYYFKSYPHIIRKNRTSVAVLTGQESPGELEQLADDVYQYFGLGCRNVTKLYVPEGYDFVPLLEAFRKYDYLINHHKYKNNYDYHLSIHILNNRYYMSNGSLLLVEDASPFSPISQLHYEYYRDREAVRQQLQDNASIQCSVGPDFTAFGQAQQPGICDFADRVDTMDFLKNLSLTKSTPGS
ncbi:acyl-CoA reductase [Paraflavisolibacter sp. H34]|uniref:acyl-CoA reductase n=1 Tax=Huijunlia imazamoxiresistens TaxID=3127457 RepID=UPI003016B67F